MRISPKENVPLNRKRTAMLTRVMLDRPLRTAGIYHLLLTSNYLVEGTDNEFAPEARPARLSSRPRLRYENYRDVLQLPEENAKFLSRGGIMGHRAFHGFRRAFVKRVTSRVSFADYVVRGSKRAECPSRTKHDSGAISHLRVDTRSRERFRENAEKCSPPVLLVPADGDYREKKSDSALVQTLLTGRSAAGRVDSRRAVSL